MFNINSNCVDDIKIVKILKINFSSISLSLFHISKKKQKSSRKISFYVIVRRKFGKTRFVHSADRRHTRKCDTQSLRHENLPHNLHLSDDVHVQRLDDHRESREGDLEYCDGGAQHAEPDAAHRIRHDVLQGCFFFCFHFQPINLKFLFTH